MIFQSIPTPGLGTYRVTDTEECIASVRTALEEGYRHIDTAEAYQNEADIGEAIERAEVDRDDIFLATKVFHPRFTDDYSADGFKRNVRACLDRLGVDRVDLLYAVHWPSGGYDPETTFDAVGDLAEEGLFDRLGVCNMTPANLDEAHEASDLSIDVLQVEMHPLLPQQELRSYCKSRNIDIVAYAPLGNGRVLDIPELESIADDHGVSPARVSVCWTMEKGAIPIPKATSREHIVDNLRARELDLTDEEIRRIDDINRSDRQYDPNYAPTW